MSKTYFAILSACVALLASCASQYDALLSSKEVEPKYKAAFEYFNSGKYGRAAAMFESLTTLTDRTPKDDTVRYYLGLSNYRYKDYQTAETNFTSFITSFPRSPFTEEARFLRIDCLYRSTLRYELDAKPTYTAMSAIQEYMKDYPSSQRLSECTAMLSELDARLDRKAYESALLYYRMEDYKASRVALRNVLKDDADNIYREDILYYIAMSSFNYAKLSIPSKQKERYLTFIDDYLNFVGEAPDSPYRKSLDGLYARAQKAVK